jgi:hypothetical protein
MRDQRLRQIHLDFHTSRDIEGVAADFDAEAFAVTMADAHVDSVNVFAKCHHGYSYYPTRVGTVHPGLSTDLLGGQIAALHERDIRAPIYLSVLWDDLAGEQHGDWVVTTRSGRTLMRAPLSSDSPILGQTGWTTLDVSSGYGDYVLAQVAELCASYPVDGFWFDIVWPEPNYSPWSQARLRAAGVDLSDADAVHAKASEDLLAFMARVRSTVRDGAPDASVFFNGSVSARVRRTLPMQTHLEVESLPTSGADWGYLHYPVMSRFARTFGVPFVGMTGRFHKSWADFGGLKTGPQLAYECGTILSAGGAVSIGDQLDPAGRLDAAVYRRIGAAYAAVEALEPWLVGAVPLAEVAVLGIETTATTEELVSSNQYGKFLPEVEGIAQVLLECGIQFDVVDPEVADLTAYRAVFLPDGCVPDAALSERIDAARAMGVKLVLSGTAGLDPATGQWLLKDVPVDYRGPAPTTPSYLRHEGADEVRTGLAPDYDYVFYETAHVVAPAAGARGVGSLRRARHDRTWRHFTSHSHAPVGESLDAPVAVVTPDLVYLAAPLLGAYPRHEYWVYRVLAEELLDGLLGERLLRLDGPAWIEATCSRQDASEQLPAGRTVVHLTAYQARRSALPVPRVDEAGSIAGVTLSLRLERAASSVYLAPDRAPVEHETVDGTLVVRLPPLGTHTVVVVEHED